VISFKIDVAKKKIPPTPFDKGRLRKNKKAN
jgi:hypothetical protein